MPPYRPARAFAAALLAALLGALLPAGAARAAEGTVSGGRLDWGIKSSFQTYVTGPIANGNYRLTGGAATIGGSQFRFHSAKGSYNPETGAFEARFSGGVRFTGHRKPDGSNELELSVSRPTVRISGGRGTLHVDMVSKARTTGKVTTSTQVPFAALNLSGVNMRGGRGPVRLNNIPATLTGQGATAFAGFYTAGTPLDPISLGVDVVEPRQSAAPPKPTPETKPSATAKDTARGALRDAAVDWGVRRTFREYVTGSIAQGKWTLSGGAQDGGALFRFPSGKGTYDPKTQSLDAVFTGAVRFTGQHLDLTLTKVTAKISGGKGVLSADVANGTRTTPAVPLITFPATGFAPKNGLAALTEAPATLTAGGAQAFGNMYKAGTEMDPVSLAVAVDAGARLPALPDLGSAPAAETPSAAPSPSAAAPDAAPAASAADSSASSGVFIAVGAGVLAAASAIALYAVRRRRRVTAAPGTTTTD
ncbi:HtaA domain-containing protein [Streptomyces tsukubensis]|uniref:Htaa domain protein n=2 Tax=Streptomyces TaxID=1883 RepID=A0A7G3UKA8_STRT9|nr:HtaA domain-containing protein [Streptomyces tsukubensis]AZK93824.1 Htaa domain protein [Streptomyces tsukubensis]QKM70041.1 Htaa domain protein [Streptomyces tsukubensis NRRL18488]TAI45982.1 Htaa domain protein [Streptomyces tsukubensis]